MQGGGVGVGVGVEGDLVYGEVVILCIVYCALCSLNVGCWYSKVHVT